MRRAELTNKEISTTAAAAVTLYINTAAAAHYTVITMQYLVSSSNRVFSILLMLTFLYHQILLSLAACALSAPQQVPYVHQEIPAEPYVHVEIPAEPYVHQEVPAEPYYGGEPTGYAGPAWTGGCVNNLGQGVPCRN